jgi:hypothetical protein
MYTCRHFKLAELVYPELYKDHNGNSKLWVCFDVRLLAAIDDIRDFIGIPVAINSWASGGTAKSSGLRPLSDNIGAKLSQHKFGRAADLKFNSKDWTPEKLREYMKKIGCFEPGFLDRTDDEARPFIHIRRIEWMRNMSWFHLDTYESDIKCSTIQVFTG